MRKHLATITLTAATIGLVSGLAATTPAFAAPGAATAKTWTITPGGAATATSGTIRLTDTATKRLGSCTSSVVSGQAKAGTGLAGQDIGSVTAAKFRGCTGPRKSPFTVTARALPWQISFTSYNPKTGVVSGTVSHLEITLTGVCTAMVTGANGTGAGGVVAASYTDSTGTLKFLTAGGNLHFWHVKGCGTLINDGDPATVSAAYTITPRQVITSP